jgi:hypothetical protein
VLNTVINENKPSDAAEVLAYYNREQYGVTLFYGRTTLKLCWFRQGKPYLDKAPNYERDKTGKYIITNNFKMPIKIRITTRKRFYQGCGAVIILKTI